MPRASICVTFVVAARLGDMGNPNSRKPAMRRVEYAVKLAGQSLCNSLA